MDSDLQQSATACAASLAQLAAQGFFARVYHKRAMGHVCFLDALLVAGDAGSAAERAIHVVELCLRPETTGTCETASLKVGDVLFARGRVDEGAPARAPRTAIVAVEEFRAAEPWAETFKTFAFKVPGFLEREEKRLPTQKQAHRAALAGGPAAAAAAWPRRPLAILQCHLMLAERVAAYFGGQLATSCSRDRLVYVYDGAREALARWADDASAIPTYLRAVLFRVYFVTEPPCASLEAALGVVAQARTAREEEQAGASCQVLPLMAAPRELEVRGRESEQLTKKPVFSRSHCDSLVYADGLFWVGLGQPRIVCPDKPSAAVPSGAYWKLHEISERYDVDGGAAGSGSGAAFRARYAGRGVGIDIGASPGGWSYCMAQDFGCAQVLAVDPAALMHELVREQMAAPTPRIVHWRMKGLDALVAMAGGGAADLAAGEEEIARLREGPAGEVRKETRMSSEAEPGTRAKQTDAAVLACEACGNFRTEGEAIARHSVGLFVCDMNDALGHPVVLFEYLARQQLFERPCLVALTFKNTFRSKTEFAERKRAAIQRISAALSHVREIHLFANTKLETTIVGQLL